MIIPGVVPSSVYGYTVCYADFSVWLYKVLCRVQCMVIPGAVPSYTRCCAEFSVWLNHVLC